MTALITADLVDLDVPSADRKTAVTALAERLVKAGRVTDLDRFLADIEAREAQMPTGLEGGIGIPHCRSAAVTEPTLAFGRAPSGVDFGAEDGPADLIFMIAAPEGGNTCTLTPITESSAPSARQPAAPASTPTPVSCNVRLAPKDSSNAERKK